MELRYRLTAGFTPSLPDRVAGLIEHADVVSFQLRLTDPRSARAVSNSDLARVFASIVHGLTASGSSRILFGRDLAEVDRLLKATQVPVVKPPGWLVVEATHLGPQELARVLERVAFTTFYMQAGGNGNTPASPAVLFNTVDTVAFVATFTLYDEAVEVVSAHLTLDAVLQAVHRVAKDEGLSLVSA